MGDQEGTFLTAVHVWAAAAWADDVLADEEVLTLKAIISVAKLTDAERETAVGWLDTKVAIDDVNVSEIAEDNRANIYAAALGVVAIDKQVAPAERKFLDTLRDALGLDEATAESLHKQAGV